MPDDRERSAVSASRDAEYTRYVSARLPSLRRLAVVLCQDWQRADDLVQATITQLYVHWGRASAAEHTDAYARAILVREFAHERRSAWARRVRLNGEVTDPAAAAVDHDAALDLRTAVAALPPRQRAALVLRFYCDLNVEQSAQLLGCSPGTIKSQTAKALHTLRGALEPRRSADITDRSPAESGRRSYGEVPDHG
jgi:RNA polymerase sigma-70 factor (sigma-E family)